MARQPRHPGRLVRNNRSAGPGQPQPPGSVEKLASIPPFVSCQTCMKQIFNPLFLLNYLKHTGERNICFVPAPRVGIRYGGPAHQAGALWCNSRAQRCLKGAGPPHRTPTLSQRTASVTCAPASRRAGVETFIFQSAGSKSGKQSLSCSSQRTRTRMPMRTSRSGSSTPTILETRRGPSSRSIHATA